MHGAGDWHDICVILATMHRSRLQTSFQTLYDALAAVARDRADTPAVLFPDRQPLSYAMLCSQVERVSAQLALLGFGKGNRIGVALPHSPEVAVAIPAIMSWATCCPIDPNLDKRACEKLLLCMEVDAMVALEGEETPVSDACRSLGVPIIWLRPTANGPAGSFSLHGESLGARALVRQQLDADDVAIVLHTSGTTSAPKVVPLTHDNWMWRINRRRIAPDDRCLCLGPLFTAGVLTISLTEPLSVGAGVIVCPDSSAASILQCIDRFQPTYYSASPAVHRSVLEAIAAGASLRNRSLRFVRSGATALPVDLQGAVERVLGVPLLQGYGMTETGVIAQEPLPPVRRVPGSVGLPCGLEVQVEDGEGNPQPANAHGEIAVRGPGVMTGYDKSPDANQRAFRNGWFMTGDLGYVNEDGYLFVTGRVKELINRGGLKLSPAEVDEALALHPAVREAAAFTIAHPTLGEDIAAAVVLHERGAASEEELRAFAIAGLAPHKVPTRILIVEAIPRTALGKVLRSDLTDRFAGLATVPFEAPRNDREALVATLFANALGNRMRVGIHDNFFELGGDSLRAAQVVSQVNGKLGLGLGPTSLFEHPTVAQFCFRLESTSAVGTPVFPPITPRRRPAVPGDERRTRKTG